MAGMASPVQATPFLDMVSPHSDHGEAPLRPCRHRLSLHRSGDGSVLVIADIHRLDQLNGQARAGQCDEERCEEGGRLKASK